MSYLFRYKDNVADLKQNIVDLKGAKQRMEGEIGVARRKGQVIEADVEQWISSVDTIMSDAETFLASEDLAAQKIACFHLGSRYKSSNKATNKASSVHVLYEKRNNFPAVASDAPPLGIEANASINIDAYESQKSTMKEITDSLMKENVNIVGICGIGGVGKTTLVTELGKRVKGKPFDDVVMVVVSRKVEVEKVQQDIATRLGMDQLPPDANSRREKLWDRILRGGKVLVILDDVWSILDLNELGIPVGKHKNSNCKVVLTSRNEAECGYMDARKIIVVTPMPENEAWDLFKYVVVCEDAEEDLDKNQIEGKIFNECGGLPIAIMAVGMALRNKSKNEWELVYQNLKAVSPIYNPVVRAVYPVLETSYTFLKDEQAKRCFLLCSLFPEDAQISVELLAKYGMGLEIFQHGDGSLRDARLGARNAVNTLKYSHLLLPGEDHHHVRMHDVVRDVAIAIASKDENNKFLVKAGEAWTMLPADSLEKYTGISLMQSDISELSVGLKCPALQILLLQGNKSLKLIPLSFFQEMNMLKVIDLRQCSITSLPQSLSICTSLSMLHLDFTSVEDIYVLEGLSELEILSLYRTRIDHIPQNIGRLKNLRLLDVRHCYKLSHIAFGVISSLHNLEDLYIGSSFTKWDVQEEGNPTKNASLTELHSLQRLTNLDIAMPSLETVPHNFQFKSLERFVVSIGNIRHDSFTMYTKNNPQCCALDLTGMGIPLWGWIKKMIKEVKILRLDSFENVNNIINDVEDVDFNNLRCLELSKFSKITCLVDMVEFDSTPAFSNLEELRLSDVSDLSQIIHGQPHPTDGLFMKLRKMDIAGCHKISIVLEFNLLPRLQNLQILRVGYSRSLKYIFGSRPESYKQAETKFLPMLETLELSSLLNLVDICGDDVSQLIGLRNLEFLLIRYCTKLTKVFSSTMVKGLECLKKVNINDSGSLQHIFEPLEVEHMGIQSDYGASCLQNLHVVELKKCKIMRYVFSPSIAKCLLRLGFLRVYDCNRIEAIIGLEENTDETEDASKLVSTTTEKMVMFPSLSKISLSGLDGLKCFSLEPCNIT